MGGFPTEAAAKRARDEARIAAGRGEFVDRSTLTVGEYLDRWLLAHALEVKPRTRAGYEHLISTYVAPRIGRIRLQALRFADLSTLYRQLMESGGRGGKPLLARSVEYVHAVLRKAFADAVRNDQLLTSNHAERAKRPRKQQAATGLDAAMTPLSGTAVGLSTGAGERRATSGSSLYDTVTPPVPETSCSRRSPASQPPREVQCPPV